MNILNIQFVKSCASASQFPRYQHPEIAFFGRSNVGKSSLINMLMKKKNLVKTGSKPGVTKTVNFFLLNDSISIADLPGFGYAKVPLEIKKAFLPLIKRYIDSRDNLKLAFLLIDIRRTPDRFETGTPLPPGETKGAGGHYADQVRQALPEPAGATDTADRRGTRHFTRRAVSHICKVGRRSEGDAQADRRICRYPARHG